MAEVWDSILKDLGGLDEDELKSFASNLSKLGERDPLDKPKNDDELHAWIKDQLELNIPRVAVCPGHSAPFDPIADLFFERVDSALVMAARGSGKSYTAALWNFLNCTFTPEVDCLSLGAIEIQAKRVYDHVRNFQSKVQEGDLVLESLISKTKYKNRSSYEIITGTKSSVNGPHPQKVHRDEAELMDRGVYFESLQMERSKKVGGKTIKAQTLITSTRKTSDGLMQELLDTCAAAEKEGRKPPFKVYIYCIKEVVENQPSCRRAYPDLPDSEKCECDKTQNGEWDEGVPRLLEDVCDGAFARSEGFTPIDDVIQIFSKSSKAIWEAQQECKRPYIEDISIPEFSRERHGIKNFIPDPANGPIYMGGDAGGTSPFSAEWGQITDFELEVESWEGLPKRIPEGSLIIFDELYQGDIGNDAYIKLIKDKEREWRQVVPNFKVAARFVDPQAAALKTDMKVEGLPCMWPAVTRDREEHTKRLRARISENLFFVDLNNCTMFVEEIEAWNIKVKKFDHAVDATNYLSSNAYVIEQKGRKNFTALPLHSGSRELNVPNQFSEEIPIAKPKVSITVRGTSSNPLVNDGMWSEEIV